MTDAYRCRSCGKTDGQAILDLGMQPLANRLLTREDLSRPELRYPLCVFVSPSSWLVQLTATASPEELFSEYLYFSSFSDEMLKHAASAASRYVTEFKLDSNSKVVEIASNDGYLLKNFVAAGIPCLGIEPARNVAEAAERCGVPTRAEFFTAQFAALLVREQGLADLVLANNVFAHVPQINDFISGLRTVLGPRGRIVLEFPYLGEMIRDCEFDTIYHEHVFYFSLLALEPIFAAHRLAVFRVERLAVHGGSLRLFVCHEGAYEMEESVTSLRQEERTLGMDGLTYYQGFADQVTAIRDRLLDLLQDLKRQGKRVAAYGASAKGNTLLNYLGLNAATIDFVVDRSPHKQGLYTPGTHLPILPTDELSRQRPDYALLLTWNFASEILTQQEDFLRKGGKFIRPIPWPVIL